MPLLLVKGLRLIKPTLDALMKSAHAVSLTERCCVIRNLITLHEGEKGHADTGNSERGGGGISAVRAALSKDFLAGKIAVEHLSSRVWRRAGGPIPSARSGCWPAAARSLDAPIRTITLTDGTEIKADGEVMPPGHPPGRCRYWQGRLTSGAWTMRRTGLSIWCPASGSSSSATGLSEPGCLTARAPWSRRHHHLPWHGSAQPAVRG